MLAMVERVLGLVAEVVCLEMLEELAFYMQAGWIGSRVGEYHVQKESHLTLKTHLSVWWHVLEDHLSHHITH